MYPSCNTGVTNSPRLRPDSEIDCVELQVLAIESAFAYDPDFTAAGFTVVT
jgi:hypothetical protein